MKKNIWIILLTVVIIVIMILSITNIINDSFGMSLAFFLFLIFSIYVFMIAKKYDVKLIEYLMLIFALMSAVCLIFNAKAYFKTRGMTQYKFQIVVNKKESEKKLLFNYDGHDYYTYNLNKVEVIMREGGKKYTLKNALEKKIITLDEILELAIPNDGTEGYKIYYDGGQKKYDNDEYSIIECQGEKTDIIFSTFDYKYNPGICK